MFECAIFGGIMRLNERDDIVTVDEIEVADPADAWTRAGFSVDSDAVCRIGGVRIRLAGPDRGAGIGKPNSADDQCARSSFGPGR